jgi:hypothetical protein
MVLVAPVQWLWHGDGVLRTPVLRVLIVEAGRNVCRRGLRCVQRGFVVDFVQEIGGSCRRRCASGVDAGLLV